MIFDADSEKVGERVGAFTIQDVSKLVETVSAAGIKVAMLAVPAAEAQRVANQLIEAGVQAILNYAPISINVPPGVQVQYIDPTLHLQRMTFYIGK